MNGEHHRQNSTESLQKKPLQRRLFSGLLVLALLTPCGIILPRIFHADGAWGEWGTERLGAILGYLPEGMKGSAHVWKAPVSDYNFFAESSSLVSRSLAYAVSGLLGLALAACLILILIKVVKRHER
jgi:cobalt/nickel transport protein